jgi:hypothetical protein
MSPNRLGKRAAPARGHFGAARSGGVEPIKPEESKAHRLTVLCLHEAHQFRAGNRYLDRLSLFRLRRRRLRETRAGDHAKERSGPATSAQPNPCVLPFTARRASRPSRGSTEDDRYSQPCPAANLTNGSRRGSLMRTNTEYGGVDAAPIRGDGRGPRTWRFRQGGLCRMQSYRPVVAQVPVPPRSTRQGARSERQSAGVCGRAVVSIRWGKPTA